jgi:hypothetical protein
MNRPPGAVFLECLSLPQGAPFSVVSSRYIRCVESYEARDKRKTLIASSHRAGADLRTVVVHLCSPVTDPTYRRVQPRIGTWRQAACLAGKSRHTGHTIPRSFTPPTCKRR